MKQYETKHIRNIAVLGHLGSGKTTLTEALLYAAGAIEKKGEVERKNTVSDYLPEEHSRLSSVSTSLIPIEWKGYKLNFLDVPGSEEFVGEINQALEVIKGAVIVIDAAKGVEIGTERLWLEIRKRHIPAVLFINKMDKENVKFEELLEQIRVKLGKKAVPFCWPIGHEADFEGFVNVVDMKARIYDGTQCVDAEIWEEKRPKVEELHNMIVESVAETSEELLEKFFGGETISQEEIHQGLRSGVLNGELTPVLVGSATKTIGVHTMLDMLSEYLPAPNDLNPLEAKNIKTQETVTRHTTNQEPFSAYVFKTTVDPFVGTISLFKINSGTLKVGQEYVIANIEKQEKVNQLFTLQGKTQVSVETLSAGDIGAIAKVDGLMTGFTLTDPKSPVIYEPVPIPTPTIYVAIHPKNKNDEDKISSALQRLNLEDPTFQIVRNKETAQQLIGGQGMNHIGFVLEKLKNMFKVDVDTSDQKIVYRETIKVKTQAQGRHKKQSGGAGQFGDVHIRFEPTDKDFEFAEEVFGGSVPKNYFPAVEKGLIEALEHGPLAGFPVIGVKATLYDGSYHAVDSNELSFKLAAQISFKNACETAKPTILEPIMHVEVTVKDEYVGDVMGDANKRRGRVLGMEPIDGGMQRISIDVPEAEIIKYTIDLKALTQGSGSFTREFARYEEVPSHLIDRIIAEYKK